MRKELNDELKQQESAVNKAKRNKKSKNINGISYNMPIVGKCTSESISSSYYNSGIGGYGLNLI